MSEIQDQILYADDSQYINEIQAKLENIRQKIGIDIYEQNEHVRTPQSQSEQFNNDHKEHNTFGKEKSLSENEQTKQLLNDVQNIRFESSPKQATSVKEQSNYREESLYPQQISFLQNKLEALKQIYPCQGDQATFLERENAYLKIELELKTKQERFIRQQFNTLQEEYMLKCQQLNQNIQSLKQQHEDFVQATDLNQDAKQYILSLESDLYLFRSELDMFTARLAKEQSEKEQLIQQNNNIYTKARDEFQGMYEKAFKELQFMVQALSAELLNESISKKTNRVTQQTNLNKMYQDLIDEKMILETKLDSLENQVEAYQNRPSCYSYGPSVKSVYEKRLHVMKQGLLHWKTRTEQIEQIVFQWISKLRQENEQLKQSLIKKQSKMFLVFENLLREIYSQFQKDKDIHLQEIKRLSDQQVSNQLKIAQLRTKCTKKQQKK